MPGRQAALERDTPVSVEHGFQRHRKGWRPTLGVGQGHKSVQAGQARGPDFRCAAEEAAEGDIGESPVREIRTPGLMSGDGKRHHELHAQSTHAHPRLYFGSSLGGSLYARPRRDQRLCAMKAGRRRVEARPGGFCYFLRNSDTLQPLLDDQSGSPKGGPNRSAVATPTSSAATASSGP